MKSKKKKWIILAACVAGFLLVKDFLLAGVISAVASSVVGAPVSIRTVSIGLFPPKVVMRNFKMQNPPGFERGVMVDLPLAAGQLDAGALLTGKLHMPAIEIELKEIGLMKNKEGKLNVDELKVVKQPANTGSSGSMKQPSFKIDVLTVSMQRVVSKDYTSGKEPLVQVYDINLKKSYKDITSPAQLAALLMSEPMKAVGIKGAAIYGAAMLTGVGIVPVVAIAALTGKDTIQQDVDMPIADIYARAQRVLKRDGSISKQDAAKYTLEGTLNGASVVVRCAPAKTKGTAVTVSARKLMMPRQEIASGLLYKILEARAKE